MPSYDRALWALRTWLDSWAGIGHVAVGMAHQGDDLQLTRYDERGRRATFYVLALDVTERGMPLSRQALDPKVGHLTGECDEDTFVCRSGKYRGHVSAYARHQGGGR
jgi:hypothetical protein